MTLSDLDLETSLRQQRARAEEIAPAPVDLAQRVRQRARQQRRRRIALTAAGVAAALVFVGLPVLASGLVGEGSRGESASPSASRPPIPTNLDLPTRGSLADDQEWVAGVRALSWLPEGHESYPPRDELPDSVRAQGRKVAFAGDVPGGRAALVLGDLGNGQLTLAWYIGPENAAPEDMALATQPGDGPRRGPMALFARPDPASDGVVVVVVGLPGDEFELLTSRQVAASGEVREVWETVPGKDGAGALALGASEGWPPNPELHVRRAGELSSVFPDLRFADALLDAIWDAPSVEVADPRGLLAAVNPDELQWAVQALAGHYGIAAERLRPTLLAGGPVGDARGTAAVMVGVTFPSGATTVQLITTWAGSGGTDGASSMQALLDPAPAGPSLLDRVFAVPAQETITVSAPSAGVLAEIYLADGTLLTTVPLVNGQGSAPLPPPAAERVRILDGDGAVLADELLAQPSR